MKTKKEYLDWCKDRALQYLEQKDSVNAKIILLTDLSEVLAEYHPAIIQLKQIDGNKLEEVKAFIEKLSNH